MAVQRIKRREIELQSKTSPMFLQRENHVISVRMALQQLRMTVKNIRSTQSRLEFLMDEIREVIDRRGY